MARSVDEAHAGTVACWGEGCRSLSQRSLPVRFTPELTIRVVLCLDHEELLRRYADSPIFERLPAQVAEDHVAA